MLTEGQKVTGLELAVRQSLIGEAEARAAKLQAQLVRATGSPLRWSRLY